MTLKNKKKRIKNIFLISLLFLLLVIFTLPASFENVYALSGNGEIKVEWFSSSMTPLGTDTFPFNDEDDDWHQIYEKIIPPSNAKYAKIILSTETGYDAYFDDIGLIGPGFRRTSCTASTDCNERDTGDVWCDENVKKTCDSNC